MAKLKLKSRSKDTSQEDYDLHAKIVLDDTFNKTMKTIQDQIDDLWVLYKEFEAFNHRPVNSQTDQLINAKGSFGELAKDFIQLKATMLKK